MKKGSQNPKPGFLHDLEQGGRGEQVRGDPPPEMKIKATPGGGGPPCADRACTGVQCIHRCAFQAVSIGHNSIFPMHANCK